MPGAGRLPLDFLALPLTTTCTGAVAPPRRGWFEREDPPIILRNEVVSWEISLFNFFADILVCREQRDLYLFVFIYLIFLDLCSIHTLTKT